MSKLKFKNKATIEKFDDKWNILVVDDDATVHLLTEMVLKDFIFDNKKLNIIRAYSGIESIEIMTQDNDIVLILMDIVMESLTAGLDAIDTIRNKLKNHNVRIVIRTGQAGYKTKSEIMQEHSINDYEQKEYLTNEKLQSIITLQLKKYKDSM